MNKSLEDQLIAMTKEIKREMDRDMKAYWRAAQRRHRAKKKAKKKVCKHPGFWFDRRLSYCLICGKEHMDSVCTECAKTTCQIKGEK